jgi:hypothetical protein
MTPVKMNIPKLEFEGTWTLNNPSGVDTLATTPVQYDVVMMDGSKDWQDAVRAFKTYAKNLPHRGTF